MEMRWVFASEITIPIGIFVPTISLVVRGVEECGGKYCSIRLSTGGFGSVKVVCIPQHNFTTITTLNSFFY